MVEEKMAKKPMPQSRRNGVIEKDFTFMDYS
jgi:hypothetical protein